MPTISVILDEFGFINQLVVSDSLVEGFIEYTGIESSDNLIDHAVYKLSDSWHTLGPEPAPGYVLNRSAHRWEIGLDLAKDLKWAEIKAERARREVQTFSYAGNVYDSDQVRISGVALSASIAVSSGNTSWSQNWVLTNNTIVTLTSTEMISVGEACRSYVSGLWNTSQTRRAAIYAATTVSEVEAITW
jgi:hypothetical protein